MSKSHAITATLSAAAVVVALGACAPGSPKLTTLPTGAASPSSAASPMPTPTPTAAALAVAQVRIPFGCEDAAPANQLSAAMGTPLVLETTAETWRDAAELRPYAFVQAGALDCSWSTHPGQSGNFTNYRVLVAPDVTAAKWTQYKVDGLTASAPATPYGGNSNLHCSTTPANMRCSLTAYIGTTFVSVTDFSTAVTKSLSSAATFARFEPLFTTLVNEVTSATIVEPGFADALAKPVTYSSEFTISDAAISVAVGVPNFTFHSEAWGPIIDEDGPEIEPEEPVNFRWEGGGGGNSSIGNFTIGIEVLPAGAWAYPDIVSASSTLPGLATISGVGNQAVVFSPTAASSATHRILIATSGHNLFSIDLSVDHAKPGQDYTAIAEKLALAVMSGIGS
ncbi:MAG TPA: hypothetical protein VGM94_15180 [Galbitalea sp.]|jgi:hypothetical protein